jgi:hypothetical protein
MCLHVLHDGVPPDRELSHLAKVEPQQMLSPARVAHVRPRACPFDVSRHIES